MASQECCPGGKASGRAGWERGASGHQSDRYIWRYVKPDQQTLADAVDELE